MDSTTGFLSSFRSPSCEVILGGCLFLFIAAGVYSARREVLADCSPPKQSARRLHDISIHKTQIIKCNISHHRLFPKKHGFVYPHLSVGIPVRTPRSNWLLSVNTARWWERGWLHVSPKDHLYRGRDGETLSENVDAYLKLQRLNPADFPHVYLLTSPRFLNYVFKPASFWYLYTGDGELKYVIAEVNNTFDERRMYLFPAPTSPGLFRQTLSKDFHVSPFSSRKGSYMLSTANPAEDENISVTVTLCSSKGHPKLVARWWSDVPAMDSSTLSLPRSIWLLVSWGSTILTTFAKIVYQATLLAQVRRLKIWYRPEPRESAIPRRPTAAESFLAVVFIRHLNHLVSMASSRYSFLAHSTGITEETSYPHNHSLLDLRPVGKTGPVALNLRIHTPQFHRQLMTYERLSDLLSYALLHPYEENRTAWSDDAQGLVDAIGGLELATHKQRRRRRWSLCEVPLDVIWAVYRHLRSVQPLTGAYPDPGLPTRRKEAKRRDGPRASLARGARCFLDDFVRDDCGLSLQAQYMVATLSLQWRTRVMRVVGGE